MSAIQDSVGLPLRNRLLVVALVALAHALLAWSWVMLPSISKPVRHEMSVSVTLPAPPQPAPPKPEPPEPKPPEPKLKPVVKPKPVEPQRVQPAPQVAMPDAPEETPPTEEVSSASPQPLAAPSASAAPSAPSASTVPAAPAAQAQEHDREPDYQAAYLRNPVPSYPMVARRMGWQGRVVLNVEVLASGLPGQVNLYQSSGHDVLDNAAIKAVSSWRFVAARQNGQAAAKWFLVPIPFILKEAE